MVDGRGLWAHHRMAGVPEHCFRSRAHETIARAGSSHSVQVCMWPRKRARFLPSDSSPVTLTTAQPISYGACPKHHRYAQAPGLLGRSRTPRVPLTDHSPTERATKSRSSQVPVGNPDLESLQAGNQTRE